MPDVSVRRRLLNVVIASVLPVALAAGAALVALLADEQESARSKSLEVTRLSASAIETEIQRNLSSLRALSFSQELRDGNIVAFSTVLRRVVQETPEWLSATLRAPDGRLLVDTAATGSPDRLVPDPTSLAAVVRTRRPAIGTLSQLSGVWSVVFRVPVLVDGQLAYVLSARVSPTTLKAVVDRQGLPSDWVASVFDATGARVARSKDHEKSLGGRGSPMLQALMATPEHSGVGISRSIEGVENYSAFVRLPEWGWSVAVGIPTASVAVAANRALFLYGGGIALSLLAAMLAARHFARRVTEPVTELSEAAAALGRGELPEPANTDIAELAELDRALQRAAQARKRAEQSLRQQEDLLRATFEQSAVGMLSATLDGEVQRVNGAFARLLGTTPAALRGRQILEFTDPLDREKARWNLGELIGGRVGQFVTEERYLRADGSSVWCQSAVTLLKDAEGRPQSVMAVTENIDARRAAEVELRRSEEFNRGVIESSRDCIKTLDLDGRVLWISARGLTAMNLSDPADVIGASWIEMWQDEDRPAAAAAVRAANGGAGGSMVGSIRIGGEQRWWDVSIAPILDAGGRPERLLAISREITDRFHAEALIRDERRMLELLNRTGAALASQLDLQALLQAVTDAGSELSGAEFGAFLYSHSHDAQGPTSQRYVGSGSTWAAFKDARSAPLFAPTFQGLPAVRCADLTADPDYRLTVPMSEPPVRSYLGISVVSRSGEVIGGLFFGHSAADIFTPRSELLLLGLAAQAAVAIDNARLYDIAQRAAEERSRLLESERAARAEAVSESASKDEFLAILSHELRTPLSSVLGWTQILARPGISEADRQRGLEVIERNARLQTQLIDELLDMSRIVAGKVGLEMRALLLAPLVEACVEAVRPAAAAKGLSLSAQLSASTAPVMGDPARLQQVVSNLLANAIKFTPTGGRVEVELQPQGDAVEIRVRDSGIGIGAEFLPRVFQRFRQADSSITRRHGGLGLGLAISRQLVELQGGRIEARSEGENCGAEFVVVLPTTTLLLAPVAPEPEAEAVNAGSARPLSQLRVLVVDDEPDARELTARVLEESGALVTAVSRADEALRVLGQRHFDLLITDLGMPDVDGYELLRWLRQSSDLSVRTLPAVALTAFGRPQDLSRSRQAGFHAHLIKPVEPELLVAVVAGAMGELHVNS